MNAFTIGLTLLVSADFQRLPFVVVPATTDVVVPFYTPIGMTFVLQEAALDLATGFGNFSNAVTLTIE